MIENELWVEPTMNPMKEDDDAEDAEDVLVMSDKDIFGPIYVFASKYNK